LLASAVINALDAGFCLIELLYDAEGHARDYRFLDTNPAFARQTGLTDCIGRTIGELAPDHDRRWIRHYESVASTGEAVRFVDFAPAFKRWFDVSAFRVSPAQPHRIGILCREVSQQQNTEQRNLFLSELSVALAPLTGEDELIETAVTALGRHLSAGRCYFLECFPAQNRIIVSKNWVRPGVASIQGELPLHRFGGLDWWDRFVEGDFAVTDVRTHPLTRAHAEAYGGVALRSYAVQPYRKEGQVRVVLAATDSSPRTWTPYETALLADVAARVWPLVERARTEAALREREARYRAVFQSIDEGFCILDVIHDDRGEPCDYRFLEANAAFERHTGLTGVSGRTARELVPNLEDHWPRIYGNVAATGTPIRFEEHSEAMGRWFDVHATAVGGTRVALVFVDVTEQRLAQQRERDLAAAAISANAKFRTIFDQSSVFAGILSTDGRLLEANRLCLEGCGYTDDQALNRFFPDTPWWRLAPDSRRRIAEAIPRAAAGETFSSVLTYHWAEGGARLVDFALNPIRENGRVAFLHATGVDITQRRQAEVDLHRAHALLADKAKHLESLVEQRTAKLRETIGELEAFSYSIAHDMRAPLRSLKGFSDILLEEHKAGLETEAQRYLERIAAAADRMDKLIQDVLSYSRIVRTDLTLAPVRLAALLPSILETYPHFAPDRAQIVFQEPLPTVLGNEAMLTQIFSNLLGNAVKFVAPGVTPRVTISASRTEAMVRVQVADNGIGILPEQRDKIFEMFHQVSNLYEGTGIGLAIVRKSVERMGGRVGVQSRPGSGSVFWFELPAA
jgi:PAS domain S-box-containing protein